MIVEDLYKPVTKMVENYNTMNIALQYIYLDTKDRAEPFCEHIYTLANDALKDVRKNV